MTAQQTTIEGLEKWQKPAIQTTEIDLLQIALNNNGAIDIIKELASLKRDADARKAEVEFNDAMNRAQSELGRVAPDLTNPQTRSKYASYSALDRAIRPVYTKEGFSLSFDTGETSTPDTVLVLCYVSHRGGHTRTYRCLMPADGMGAKGGAVMTKTHATGAAQSYGMRYLLKMIFNVAVGEEDTDGNMTNGWVLSEINAIENAKTLEGLKQTYFAAFNEAKEQKAANAMLVLTQAYDRRKAEL